MSNCFDFLYRVHIKSILNTLFLLAISLSANPVQFQIDQVNYIYFNPPVNQAFMEKFHKNFLLYYSKTFDELNAKKKFPLIVELYTDPESFRKHTKLPSFTAGFFDSEAFNFLLTNKTTKEETLITLISHESCHAALASRQNETISIHPVLEEGFCYFNYPPDAILNRNIRFYCKKNFNEFLTDAKKNLDSNDKKKREEVYLVSSWFINFIGKEKSKEDLVQILLAKDTLKELEAYWNRFREKCKK